MDEIQIVRQWLEAGKQVGKSFSYIKDGETRWSTVAMQKWMGGYKLYIDDILESNMVDENYAREEIIFSTDFVELASVINETTPIRIESLAPRKGKRFFNPSFD